MRSKATSSCEIFNKLYKNNQNFAGINMSNYTTNPIEPAHSQFDKIAYCVDSKTNERGTNA